jgi:aspartate/methionine/tyrosine aminotransferase
LSTKYPFTLIKQEIVKREGKALDFAVGTPPFSISATLLKWIRDNSDLALVPAHSSHISEFKATAAEYLQRQYRLEVLPHCILPAAGGRAAMSVIAACKLSPGDTVVVTEPGYPAFARIAAQRGARVAVSYLNPDDGFLPDVEHSSDIDYESVAMIAVNYPNNPSGAVLSDAVENKLDTMSGNKTILFNDATYGPLVYGRKPRSLLSAQPASYRTREIIELHSFSKLFPIGPLAVSFIVGSEDLIESIATFSEYAWSPLSRLHLAATAECLRHDDRIERFRHHIPAQMKALQTTLEHVGLRSFPADSGMYILCQTPSRIAEVTVDSAQSAAKLLMDRFDIAVVPVDTETHSYLRFSALFRPQDLEKLSALRTRLKLS